MVWLEVRENGIQGLLSFCLGIYDQSPRVYNNFRKSPMLILPSESLLRVYQKLIKQKSGENALNKCLIAFISVPLRSKVVAMLYPWYVHERLCGSTSLRVAFSL